MNYVHAHGHPSPAAICGIPDCENAGVLWLNAEEVAAYNQGQRVFPMSTNAAKLRASDDGLHSPQGVQ